MASNSIFQNGNHCKTNSNTTTTTTINSNNSNLRNSSSSQYIVSNNTIKKKIELNNMPNGYRVSPKIPTKAEIDQHLENFIMSRKIALNGGNELRIDDKNISLHLNNPFVTSFAQQQQLIGHQQPEVNSQLTQLQLQQQKLYLFQQQQAQVQAHAEAQVQAQHQFTQKKLFNETITEKNIGTAEHSLTRPKRPHSIAVSSPIQTINNNDLNATSTFQRRQKITNPNIVGNGGLMKKIVSTTAASDLNGLSGNSVYCSPINYAHFNENGNGTSPGRVMQPPFRGVKSEFSLYTPPSPIAISEAQQQQQQHQQQLQQKPNVPQRRSQSIPRQVMSQNVGQISSPITGVQTLNRPRSLDRYSNVNHLRQPTVHSSPHNNQMKQSQTFHGQQMLSNACYQSDVYEEGDDVGGGGTLKHKKDRPMSYAYGTVPEQIYLENQLRIYSEQLKNITESVKKYSEQQRVLSELKRQQIMKVPTSKSDSKLSQNLKLSSILNTNSSNEDDKTPSHQLRLFLDNIRNSISSSSFENDSSDHENETEDETVPNKIVDNPPLPPPLKIIPKVSNPEPKTPSDQLRLFLDAIRVNQNTETHDTKDSILIEPKVETFSQVTDNIKLMNQDLELFNNTSEKYSLRNISKNMDQILDDFNKMASLLKNNNSVDYLQKCSDALKQTSEQIRQYNQMNGNNYSSDDSSCSTTPGSIREAVQNLLQQPRNGFQIMDDRMSIFIDIMEQQDKFSQVMAFTPFLYTLLPQGEMVI